MEPPTNVSGCTIADVCPNRKRPNQVRFNGAAHERERMQGADRQLVPERAGFNGAAHERERMHRKCRGRHTGHEASMEPPTNVSGCSLP